MYVYTHVCKYVCMNVCMNVRVSLYMYVHARLCVCIHVCIHARIYGMYVCMCACMYHTYINDLGMYVFNYICVKLNFLFFNVSVREGPGPHYPLDPPLTTGLRKEKFMVLILNVSSVVRINVI